MSRSQATVRAYWLGRVAYRPAWALQRALVERVRAGTWPSSLLLLEHEHVFSMGRRASLEHVIWDEAERRRRGVEVVWSDRGGDVTYHGPGQLVGYPIVDLPALGTDILGLIRGLERSLIAYLSDLGIAADPGQPPAYTGVWVGEAKVAAIGVKLNHSVSNHGFALNLTTDLGYFAGIVPCGIDDKAVTSVAELGVRISVEEAAAAYAEQFGREFGCRIEAAPASELAGLERAAPPEPDRLRLLPGVPAS
jgi:lipoate-protein ligase B